MLPHRFDAWSLLTHLSPKTIECCHEFVAVYISTTNIHSICINFPLCRFYSQMVNQSQIFWGFILFNFFLLFITLVTSLLFDNLIIDFFGLAFWFSRWQASTCLEFTVTAVSLKIFRTVFSKLLFGILSGIPDISKHSRIEYCVFAAHFLSRVRFCFT